MWVDLRRGVRRMAECVSNEITAQNAEFDRNGNGLHYLYTPHKTGDMMSTLWLEVSPQGASSQCTVRVHPDVCRR